MEKKEALQKAIDLLTENGYEVGNGITAPETNNPEDAISIQDQLSDIVFDEEGETYTFQLRYEGDKLKLVQTEI